tara:strand:- start:9366 stop:9620 length:255 start_codon:yes stop_codon:yes gene_type:complete
MRLEQLDLRAVSGDHAMAKHALLNGGDRSGGFRYYSTMTKLTGDGGFSGVDRVVKRDRLFGRTGHGSTGSHQKEQQCNDSSATE